MNANAGRDAWRVNDYTGTESGGEALNQLPSVSPTHFCPDDKKGQVLEGNSPVYLSKKQMQA